MFDSLVRNLEAVFVNLDLRRLLMLLFVIGVLYLGNQAIGYSYYYNIQSQIESLKELQSIQQEGIPEELSPLYNNLIQSLEQKQTPPTGLLNLPPSIAQNALEALYKFALGSSAFLLFALYFAFRAWRHNTPQDYQGLLGASILALLVGSVATALPPIEPYYMQLLSYAILQTVAFVAITLYGRMRRLEEQT